VIRRLIGMLGARPELLCVQLPLHAADGWAPEPDLALAVAPPGEVSHLTTARLVVEVAVTSLAHDERKAAIYAAAAVPRHWIVDVPGARVVEHTGPTSQAGYRAVRDLRGDDELDARVDGVPTTSVSAILG
jgi:Uma2 family endonuclease